jgi:DNA-binding NarL/FixJ family response regulator
MSALPETSPLPIVLLSAPVGRFQESLRILLSGLPLQVVGPVAEARSTLALLHAWQPALVLLDFALAEAEVAAILHCLQLEWHEARLVALVDSVDQLAEAKAWGIRKVLLRGFRLEELYGAISSQLAGAPLDLVPPAAKAMAEP